MKDRDDEVDVSALPSNTLDWKAFSAAYFPGRRRHDFEALTAYGSYRRRRPVPGADRVEPSEGRAGETLSLAVWADEGGQAPLGSTGTARAV